MYETSAFVILNQKICQDDYFFPEKSHLSAQKCGEETSPTPQTDWSLAHGFKTAFGLKSCWKLLIPPFVSTNRFSATRRASAHLMKGKYCAN